MKFQSFKVTAVKEINKFLKENENGIPANGVHYHEGSLCILSTDPEQSGQEKEMLIGSIKDFIQKRQAEHLGLCVDEEYYRYQSKKGLRKEQDVVDVVSKKDNLMCQIDIARAIQSQIEKGTFVGLK